MDCINVDWGRIYEDGLAGSSYFGVFFPFVLLHYLGCMHGVSCLYKPESIAREKRIGIRDRRKHDMIRTNGSGSKGLGL